MCAGALGLAIGHSGTQRYLRRLTGDEKRIEQVTHDQIAGVRSSSKATLISESGLYKLVMRSDKPEAKRFQDWVTRDVLPAIRKTGSYVMGEEKVKTGEMSLEEMTVRVISAMQAKLAGRGSWWFNYRLRQTRRGAQL